MASLAHAVRIKSSADIAVMRTVGRLAADTLQRVGALIRPGITTAEIDDFVVADTKAKGAIAAPLGYAGPGDGSAYVPFPRSCCTSVNQVVWSRHSGQ
ncbi:MAG: M24 family metallopeptidase [Proteobacteria bacterium]|nr:M24 family metallopeptidase [Pseudomonadota bacterium]